MWAFAAGNTKHVFQQNLTAFIESAHETADHLAHETADHFYGVALQGRAWTMETPLNRVGGEHGWITTQVMRTVSSDGRVRRWQWELRQNRRPPLTMPWLLDGGNDWIFGSQRKL
jgi:hypothetical protein